MHEHVHARCGVPHGGQHPAKEGPGRGGAHHGERPGRNPRPAIAGPITAGPITAGPITAGPITAGPITARAVADRPPARAAG